MGRNVRAHGCGLRACEAYGRAVVEEIRGATEGERTVSGLFPEEVEEVDRSRLGFGYSLGFRVLRYFSFSIFFSSCLHGLLPEEFEEIDRLTMGEDVQQAQKLSVDAA